MSTYFRTRQQQNPEKILLLGGDCAVELAPVSFLNQQYQGDLAVIWLDAHGDLNSPDSSPSKLFHGMPLRALLGEGDQAIANENFSCLNPEQVFLAGAREFDKEEINYINDNKMTVFSIEDLSNFNIIRTIKNKAYTHAYVHIDLDVLDPSLYPFIMCPTSGGCDFETLNRFLDQLNRELNIVGLSVVEFVANEMLGIHEIKNCIDQVLTSW